MIIFDVYPKKNFFKFKFFFKLFQHHCRKCGQLVCGACSKNNYLLINISSKPVRVCDQCFDELKNRKTASENSIDDIKEELSDMDFKVILFFYKFPSNNFHFLSINFSQHFIEDKIGQWIKL